ncbi:hypothetical protein TSUD_244990 [Trifolium subterraneum]|uniref:Reverse transcriptase zinc-binding domain-containing protein n=1 Tax=Trifolium subterraneum TaxID=3900 RepID=A0A2Z6N9K1_TRISU|nr:hypothetical protein TSUD_244990 [Trifolium subterraneum]
MSVIHLLWRLCRGCIPTRYSLVQRRVKCTLHCPVCDEVVQDELHVFFNCTVARDSWCAAGLSLVLHNNAYQQTTAMDRIFATCSSENSDTCEYGNKIWLVTWEKPDSGWVKCNVDVAFVTGSGKTSMELYFRDSNGQFMTGMTQ